MKNFILNLWAVLCLDWSWVIAVGVASFMTCASVVALFGGSMPAIFLSALLAAFLAMLLVLLALWFLLSMSGPQ